MDREKVIEGLEKVWDAFNHMEHELYADYVFDALALIDTQYKLILELQNLISIGTKMMNGDEA